MSEQQHARLQWVLVDGNLHHVGDFAHLPPKERPNAFCPICSQKVILKLGSTRVHHCAHQPDVECAATQPETAIHLNTKLHVYRQLAQAKLLKIEERCAYRDSLFVEVTSPKLREDLRDDVVPNCQKIREQTWLQDWDRVEVEYAVGSRRPDLVFLRNGEIIGAIEVFVSHAVDEQKATYLKALGVPWLEIIGSEDFYSGDTAWTADKVLLIHRMQPRAWVCNQCLQEYDQKVYAAKIADFYYPSGKNYRELYLVVETRQGGERIELRLQNKDGEIFATQLAPITNSSIKALNRAFVNELERKKRRMGAIVDSPMKWDREILPTEWEYKRLIYRDDDYPRRYVWEEKDKKWVLSEGRKALSWDAKNEE